MRYYWEVLFNTEYFPYWEFTMLMMLCLQLSQLWRLNRMENKINKLTSWKDELSKEEQTYYNKLRGIRG